ncbi:MAG: chemotaxis protein CheD [Deltaproteobacteria bacterium HGW-Deltaproteobacteria-15]|nr:MAG: chemotaxis protein CheD [Deltaproteobacteria bacterium HGW-Deltaproteobacteria-15]
MNIIVGVSDMKVSKEPDSVLVTYSLGSCIGVSIWDRVAHVGGMLHFMLPESSLDPEKAQVNPFMFADTGIPALFKAAYALGAKKQQMKVIVVGGAQVLDQQGFFNIGKRNHMAIRKIFWKNNVMVDYENVGGNTNRTLKLAVRDGKTWLKVSGQGVTEI